MIRKEVIEDIFTEEKPKFLGVTIFDKKNESDIKVKKEIIGKPI